MLGRSKPPTKRRDGEVEAFHDLVARALVGRRGQRHQGTPGKCVEARSSRDSLAEVVTPCETQATCRSRSARSAAPSAVEVRGWSSRSAARNRRGTAHRRDVVTGPVLPCQLQRRVQITPAPAPECRSASARSHNPAKTHKTQKTPQSPPPPMVAHQRDQRRER